MNEQRWNRRDRAVSGHLKLSRRRDRMAPRQTWPCPSVNGCPLRQHAYFRRSSRAPPCDRDPLRVSVGQEEAIRAARLRALIDAGLQNLGSRETRSSSPLAL
ncbi:hypothetical protein MTO96_013638 [Rhipicephalus appendiculatus]